MPEKKKNAEQKPAESSTTTESFGRYLMRERELRAVSLEHIADKTRIWITNLKALEADDMKTLPERVFVVGYIRAYAQCIGLNADEAVLRFEEQYKSVQPTEEHRLVRKARGPGVAIAVGAAVVGLGVAGWLLFGS